MVWLCLINASIGAVVGGAVVEALDVHQWHSKPDYILPDFRH
jgi:hypothetical protein